MTSRQARRRSISNFRKSTSNTNSISIPATTARHISGRTSARSWNSIPKYLETQSKNQRWRPGAPARLNGQDDRPPLAGSASLLVFFGIFLLDLNRAGHHILERCLALLFEFRTRQCLARQHLIAHGGVV